VRFEISTDYRLIGEIMRDRAVYGPSTDDYAPPRLEFQPREDPDIWYLLTWDGNLMLGLFAIAPQSAIVWEIHTRLLPQAYGPRAAEALREVLTWIWQHTPAQRIVTNIPETNRLALRFGARCGFEVFGRNPKSFRKDGRLVDQILMGISRPLKNLEHDRV
jgi:RimJ/RimL family protein N-acetyltransferase